MISLRCSFYHPFPYSIGILLVLSKSWVHMGFIEFSEFWWSVSVYNEVDNFEYKFCFLFRFLIAGRKNIGIHMWRSPQNHLKWQPFCIGFIKRPNPFTFSSSSSWSRGFLSKIAVYDKFKNPSFDSIRKCKILTIIISTFWKKSSPYNPWRTPHGNLSK